MVEINISEKAYRKYVTVTVPITLGFRECEDIRPLSPKEFLTKEIKEFLIERLTARLNACVKNLDTTNPLVVNETEIAYQPKHRVVQHFSFNAVNSMKTSIEQLKLNEPQTERIDWRQVAKSLYYYPGETMEEKRYFLPNGLYVRLSDIINYVNEMRDVQLVGGIVK